MTMKVKRGTWAHSACLGAERSFQTNFFRKWMLCSNNVCVPALPTCFEYVDQLQPSLKRRRHLSDYDITHSMEGSREVLTHSPAEQRAYVKCKWTYTRATIKYVLCSFHYSRNDLVFQKQTTRCFQMCPECERTWKYYLPMRVSSQSPLLHLGGHQFFSWHNSFHFFHLGKIRGWPRTRNQGISSAENLHFTIPRGENNSLPSELQNAVLW